MQTAVKSKADALAGGQIDLLGETKLLVDRRFPDSRVETLVADKGQLTWLVRFYGI